MKIQGPSAGDAGYERTRRFYLGVGFTPLEESLELWDEQNPALILIKTLD